MPAPQRRTQQARRETTIRALLDASIEILIEVGYSGASVQRICDRAELSQGALFRHFATREDLMVAVGEDIGAQLLGRYQTKLAATAKGPPDLETVLRLVRDTCRARLNQAWYELSMAARTNPTLRKALEPVARRYFADITRLARELVPEIAGSLGPAFEMLVTSVIALFDGEVTHRMLLKRPELEDTRLALLAQAVTQLTRARR